MGALKFLPNSEQEPLIGNAQVTSLGVFLLYLLRHQGTPRTTKSVQLQLDALTPELSDRVVSGIGKQLVRNWHVSFASISALIGNGGQVDIVGYRKGQSNSRGHSQDKWNIGDIRCGDT